MKQPPELLLEIEALDDEGMGCAVHNERAVRVKNALPGEAVTARVLRKRRGMLLAEAREVSGAHEHRRRPPCPHFPRCGGCTLQHFEPQAQLAFKEQQILSALADEGVEPEQVRPAVSGPLLGYRHKARLGVKALRSGVVVGFRESFSARVGRLEQCLTLAEPFAGLLPQLRALVASLDAAERVPQLELAAGDAQAQIVLRHLDPLSPADLARLDAFEQRSGIRLLLQGAGPDSVCTLGGAKPPLLSYALREFGLSLEFAALDFTQVNPVINERLASAIVACARTSGAEEALDLFCGIGNYSLPLARSGLRVEGREGDAAAVARAQANAARNGLAPRCAFAAVDLYDPAASELPSKPLLVLDPPRSGAGPNLAGWLRPELHAVIYVSCNPRTFAADARVLQDGGLRLRHVGAYDMFPQTGHVETLGYFSR